MLRSCTRTASTSGFSRWPWHARALDFAHVLLGLFARPVAVGLVALALEPVDDAVVRRLVGAHPSVAIAVAHRHRLLVDTVEDELAILRLAASSRACPREKPPSVAIPSISRSKYLKRAPDHGARAPSASDSVSSGTTRSGADLKACPEPGAHRTGTVGRVEGEVARRELAETDPAVAAGHLLGELHHLVGVEEEELDDPLGELERRLDRLGETLAIRALDASDGRAPRRSCAARSAPALSDSRSDSSITTPSTRTREKPCPASSLSSVLYSPLRPSTTVASTRKRSPSGRARTWSTICWGVWLRDRPCRSSDSTARRCARRAVAGSRGSR